MINHKKMRYYKVGFSPYFVAQQKNASGISFAEDKFEKKLFAHKRLHLDGFSITSARNIEDAIPNKHVRNGD